MSRVQEIRETERPLEEVFAYVSDFATTAEWDPGVAEARRLDPGPVEVGSRTEVEVSFLGRRLPMTYQVVALDPPHLVVLEGEGATSRARDEIRFEALDDGGTRVTWTLDLRLRGLSRLGRPLLGPLLRRLGRVALDGLQARLDRPGPLLADRAVG